MNQKSLTITIAVCGLGLLVGYLANTGLANTRKVDQASHLSETKHHSSNRSAPGKQRFGKSAPDIRSSETLETQIQLGQDVTYAGLALWLLDASASDIAAYWEFRKDTPINGDLMRLILFNWTRLDPLAATSAVVGTDHAPGAWSGWAAHDPEAALAAVGPDHIQHVARGIGESHPAWLRENFDQIPEEARNDAIIGVATWKECDDHVATIEFLMQHGAPFNPSMFKALSNNDPFGALDWVKQQGMHRYSATEAFHILLETMKSKNPDALEKLAANTPPGALKRGIEEANFDNLLATDSDAAIARAKATEAPLMATNQLAKIGVSILTTDPDRAFDLWADILAACPDKLSPEVRITYGNGGSSWYSEEEGATKEFAESLIHKDPARALEMTMKGRDTISDNFRNMADKWASQDLPAYTNWVNRQSDPTIRETAVGKVISQLTGQGNFTEAAEWAVSGPRPNPTSAYLYHQWGRTNPKEASAWVEAANMSEDMKRQVRIYMNLK